MAALVTKPPRPTVILVGADKGGVGKTTIARALLDVLGPMAGPPRVFDTEWPRGAIKRFYPDYSEIVDITSTAGQMRIIDTLDGHASKLSIIDVRAGCLLSTLKVFQNVGLFDAAARGQVTLMIFHVLGSSISSLGEIAEVADYLDNSFYFMAKNFINDASYFKWDPPTYDRYFKGVRHALEFTVPKLDEHAYEQVELAGVSFADFVSNRDADKRGADYSFVLRGYVRNWLQKVKQEFDRIRVLDILSGKFQAERRIKAMA